MDTLSYKTKSVNKENAQKGWVLVDAENMVVGRLSSEVAKILRGKHKPSFTPNSDTGDYVIIINAEKVRFTGAKTEDKEYVRHTGYPGGQRFASPKMLLKTHPTRILEYAIHGMLPKTKLGDAIKRNLYIYAGSEHPHAAQQPKTVTF
ncbi:MAG: 50S ribosomal protein L13 [Bacteroidetes bacterium]|nr:50S ribosomal protein L13 [Bacteroidota bacterium]